MVALWAVATARTIERPRPWWPSLGAGALGAEALEGLEEALHLAGGDRRRRRWPPRGTRRRRRCRSAPAPGPPGTLWLTALSIRLRTRRSARAASPVAGAGLELALDPQAQGRVARRRVAQDRRDDRGEVERLPPVEAALARGEGQQRLEQSLLLLAERQQPSRGRAEGVDRRGGVGKRLLQQRPPQRHRRAQLVRRVGDEALLGAEGGLEPGEQVVDGVGEVLQLVAGARAGRGARAGCARRSAGSPRSSCAAGAGPGPRPASRARSRPRS